MPSTRRRRQRGAGPWRQGADTCVFKPALACKDSPTVRPGPEYVSRVTEPTDRALIIEEMLKRHFPTLISRGWITAFDKSCKPYYSSEDQIPDPSFIDKYVRSKAPEGACQRTIRADNRYADKQVNLISKRVGPAYYDFIKPMRIDDAFGMFRNAMSAAVALVPDNGPWILHTDLHSNNILRSLTQPSYMLHDWGRSLVIKNPKSKQSVVEGVKEFVNEVYNPATYGNVPTAWQMPDVIIKSVQRIYDSGTVTSQDAQFLRIWTIYIVFKNIIEIIAIPSPDAKITYDVRDKKKVDQVMNDIFVYLAGNTASQETLIRAINVIVTNLNFPDGSMAVNFVKQA